MKYCILLFYISYQKKKKNLYTVLPKIHSWLRHYIHHNLWRGQDCYGLLYLAYSFGIKTMLDCICESSFLCRCGMLLLVISCTLLKGIKHQLTPCALIMRKNFMYAVVFFAILLVDSFFFFFFNFSLETSKACFSCLSQSFRLRLPFIIEQLHL